MRWDFSGRAADKINLAFDTFSDGNNAYHFGTNPLGVRADALISNGGVMGTGSREEVYNRSHGMECGRLKEKFIPVII